MRLFLLQTGKGCENRRVSEGTKVMHLDTRVLANSVSRVIISRVTQSGGAKVRLTAITGEC